MFGHKSQLTSHGVQTTRLSCLNVCEDSRRPVLAGIDKGSASLTASEAFVRWDHRSFFKLLNDFLLVAGGRTNNNVDIV